MNLALSFDDVLLVPKSGTGNSRDSISIETHIGNQKLRSPIIGANMSAVMGEHMLLALEDEGSLGIMHRFCSVEDQITELKQVQLKAASIEGTKEGYKRAWELINAGVTVICVDTAHASNIITYDLVKTLVKAIPETITVIVGNFATKSNILPFLDIPNSNLVFKFGIGSGSMCTTRIVTGCGVPTLQSLLDVKDMGLTTMADGGMKNSGDIVKALAAGAGTVMLGSLLAGTTESPGPFVRTNNKLYKTYKGSASFGQKSTTGKQVKYIEGEETLVPFTGDVKQVIARLHDGIRSGLSYNGAENFSELRENAEFIRITNAGYAESLPHGILK